MGLNDVVSWKIGRHENFCPAQNPLGDNEFEVRAEFSYLAFGL